MDFMNSGWMDIGEVASMFLGPEVELPLKIARLGTKFGSWLLNKEANNLAKM